MVGLATILIGYVAISGTRVVSDQLAYLMSGGAVGVALVIVGMGLLVVDYFARLEQSIQAAVLGGRSSATENDELVLEVRHGKEDSASSSSMHEVVVLPGANRFHVRTCSTVARRTELTSMPWEEAVVRELTPCAVCIGVQAAAYSNTEAAQ
ncbi:MAG: hypothetical protein AB1679_14680 [Actinomycetota bacterium]